MWKVRMYMNTGFNSINVPDSETTLERAANSHRDFPAIDCLQRYFLSNIIIRAFEDDVINGDYIKLWDDKNTSRFAFYSMNGYTMTSGDTIDLSITMDPLLTCGGIDNIDFLDGMVSRRNLADGEETPTEDDPYLVPQKLTLVPVGEYFGESASQSHQYGEQLLMVRSLYDITGNDTLKIAQDVTDVTITADKITGSWVSTPVLKSEGTAYETEIRIDGVESNVSDGTIYQIFNTGAYSQLNRSQMMSNIKKLIEFGRTDVVLNMYYIPSCFSDYIHRSESGVIDQLIIHRYEVLPTAKNSNAYFNRIVAIKEPRDAYTYKAHNDRVYIGKHFAYLFAVRDSGDSVTINPEDIMYDEASLLPSIGISVDLRSNGKITYYPLTRNVYGGENELIQPYDQRALPPKHVSSKGWANAECFVNGAAGIRLKSDQFALNDKLATESVELDLAAKFNEGDYGWGALKYVNPLNVINKGVQSSYLGDVASVENTADLLGRRSDLERFGYGELYARGNEYAKSMYTRATDRMKEQQQLIQASIPQVTTVSKGSDDTLVTTTALSVYRSMISEDDVKRFDKIIDRFGVKKTGPIEKDMLTSRVSFNYIDASGVSVKCDTVPKSVRNELSSLFNGGVRIWHVRPEVDVSNPAVTKQESKEV